LAWQKRWLAVQTTAAQAPLTQTWLLAPQSLIVVAVMPSAEQLMTFYSVAAQAVAEGVQTHG
jgi:hypothetical protein